MNISRADSEPSTSPTPWRVLLRLRWPLAATIAIAFAIGQLLEAIMFRDTSRGHIVLDVIGWGLLGGFAVWASLTWVSRQEQRQQAWLEQALKDQQELNRQLIRSNSQLALLSDVNRHIADSATLDEILSAALRFAQRLAPARAAALLLNDSAGSIMVRVEGARAAEVEQLHALLPPPPFEPSARQPEMILLPDRDPHAPQSCLRVPLYDGVGNVGWIELFRDHDIPLPEDERALLQTIASEIAEAIVSVRRRSQEERAIYEMERAIADERARIARDIHDGITQTLAFRRMRIDLWLDWLETDRERLREELIDSKVVLREQIQELRRAIFALRPVQFDEFGFVGGLQRYIVEFAGQYNWATKIDLSGAPPTLPHAIEATCFRVVQEALTNSAKHAHATEIGVRIDQADDGLCIAIRDNGVGFEPGRLAELRGDHVGLRQMQERVHSLRGHVTILSQPGAGTEIRVWIPNGRMEAIVAVQEQSTKGSEHHL